MIIPDNYFVAVVEFRSYLDRTTCYCVRVITLRTSESSLLIGFKLRSFTVWKHWFLPSTHPGRYSGMDF